MRDQPAMPVWVPVLFVAFLPAALLVTVAGAVWKVFQPRSPNKEK